MSDGTPSRKQSAAGYLQLGNNGVVANIIGVEHKAQKGRRTRPPIQ